MYTLLHTFTSTTLTIMHAYLFAHSLTPYPFKAPHAPLEPLFIPPSPVTLPLNHPPH